MSEKISLDRVYREYSSMIYKFLLSKIGNESVAEELTQETFYQAVKNADKFDYSCKVSTWLCAIAKNKYYEYIKKHPVTEQIDENFEYPISLENSYIEKEGRLRIMSAIHNMPEPYREVMLLRLLSDLSFREIGFITDKTEQWARVTYYRGKLKLREELDYDE